VTTDSDSLSRKRDSYMLRSITMASSLCAPHISQLLQRVDALHDSDYDWTDLPALGISKTAWNRVRALPLPAARVFCHPDILANDPTLIGYYRGLTMLPLKGMSQLVTATTGLETGKGKLTPQRAADIARLVNQILSKIIDMVREFLSLDPDCFIRATSAVTNDGRWRNAIGEEATRIVKDMIVSYLIDHELLAAVTTKSGESVDTSQKPPVDIVSRLELANGWTMAFGSEPDVEVCDPQGTICEAFEIKGGLDPAGALERYGAAKKSFAKARSRNAGVRTTLVMSTITDEVHDRAHHNTEVHETFDLNNILLDEASRRQFLENVRYKCRL